MSGVLPSMSQLYPGKASLQWKEKVYSWSQRGDDLYWQKSLPLVLDWSVLMQMTTPNPHSFIGLKSSVLIGQNGVSLIDQ